MRRASASRAGLKFAIFTYMACAGPRRHRHIFMVVCASTELRSAPTGHYVAPASASRRIRSAGRGRGRGDVAGSEVSLAATVPSARRELAWDWRAGRHEWLNADSEWRAKAAFARGALIGYLARPGDLGSLLAVRFATCQWDDLAQRRRTVPCPP